MSGLFALQSDPGANTSEQAAVRVASMLSEEFLICRSYSRAALVAMAPGELQVDRRICPVGTVEFCREWMRVVGVSEPPPIDYPRHLRHALGRTILQVPFGEAAIGSWIKPVRTKAWDSHIKQAEDEHPQDEMVWESAVIHPQDWLSEWRVYCIGKKIVGSGRYDDGPDDAPAPDWNLVEEWVARFAEHPYAPIGFALDVARWPRETVLVEVTDGWAIGLYRGGCSYVNYARLLAARWAQIAFPIT